MNNIPVIGTSGVFTLRAPFDSKLIANASYTCKAIRSLVEVQAAGDNAYDTYYAPNNVSQAEYSSDFNNGVCIVSLVADNGTWLHVPSSFIVSFPNVSGYVYNSTAVLIDLGPIHDGLDLTYLKSRLTSVCFDTLGLNATVQTMVTSRPAIVQKSEHESIEAIRNSNISNSTTEYARLLELQKRLDAALEQNAALSQYIQDHP